MNKATLRQIGLYAGFMIIPLTLVGAIILLTYRSFNLGLIIDLIAIAIALVLFAATNPVVVRDALGRQFLSIWVNTVLLIVGFAGIMILVNILSSRATVRVDTTQTGQFSVSDSTIKILQSLNAPVTVSIVYSQNSAALLQQAQDLLNEYKQRSDKISVETVNSDVNPQRALALGAKADPDIIFQVGADTAPNKKRQETSSVDEQSFTRALLALQSNTTFRVFFVQGQGEPGLTTAATTGTSQQSTAFSGAVTALRNNNYLVDTLNLASNSTSNADVKGTVTLTPATDILIIAAPQQPFTDQDKAKIVGFLQNGGHALFLDDPTAQLNTSGQPKPNVNDILGNFGVKFDTGLTVELDPQHVGFRTPYLPIPTLIGTQSDITRNLVVYNVVLPYGSAIEQVASSPITATATYTPLYQSTTQSYLVSDVNATQIDPAKDKQGPLTLAASLELPAKAISGTTTPTSSPQTTRLALFNSYLWASDVQNVGLNQQPGTYALFLNSINWLAAQSNAVVIQPKQSDSHPFTVSQSQDTFVYYSVFLGLPLLILFVGLLVWWRRR